MEKVKVLFVCMGNICRSPTAEGVFTQLINDQQLGDYFRIDSAGTHAYHVGDAPDLRSQKAARERGVELSHLKARKFTYGDFEDFDFILAMDENNYTILIDACPKPYRDKVRYFLDYAKHLGVREVPDPYYGGSNGFERVLDLIEEAANGFLTDLQATGKLMANRPTY